MSSSRRNGSVSRAAETASKTRLHMDRNPQHSRITDPSNPAGRRKEIDNVMKRARQASPGSWDRKLLEVEEKDPNRWRHTGYKQLYLDGSKSPSPRRSRSPVGLGRRSRSPVGLGRRSRSPVGLGRRSRSPIGLGRRSRSPLGLGRRSRSPLPNRSRSARKSPRKSPPRRSRSRSRPPRPSARPPRARPPSPPHPPARKQSSPSGSSTGSCSDESCSVCSAKNKKGKAPAKPSVSAPRAPRPPPRAPPGVVPTRELLKARDATKRSREEKVLEWQRSQLPRSAPLVAVKREGARTPPRPRPLSPAALTAALTPRSAERAGSEEGEHSNRLTLSERFGKMAQWSQARSSRVNMRITRRDKGPNGLHVRIEPTDLEPSLDPAPVGSYPEELLAAAPGGLPSWDDVTVRYDYYKKRGYLRGLTLGDYVKWEEWWYKYQEWLKRERAYERWADGEMAPPRRERRRRAGRHRRS